MPENERGIKRPPKTRRVGGPERKTGWFHLSESAGRRQNLADDTELLVLEDVDNGNEYYLALVDTFAVGNREYVALNSYEPDDGTHTAPEFVIMRFATGVSGEHYYQSIRSKKELDLAFRTFFDRYIEHL